MDREMKFTLDGRIVARFLNVLLRDPDFNLDEPITDTYMFEVGDEIGISRSQVKMIIITLKAMEIVK
jgi:hypothetical protein